MFTELEHLDQVVAAISRYSDPKAVSLEVDQKQFDSLTKELDEIFKGHPSASAILSPKVEFIKKCNLLIKYREVMFQIYNKDCIVDK